jgi:hypothetical protein
MANNSSRIVTGLGVPNTQSLTGTGSPLGAVSASVGAIYTDLTDGSLYTKTSGTNTTTGWVAGASAPTVVSISASATASAWNQIILVDATSGVVTVTLPTAASNGGKSIEVKKIDSSTNAVIVDANAAETIDGALTQTISLQYNNARFISNGTNVIMESVSNGVVSEYGGVTLASQVFSTNTFADSTNGVYSLPSAGTWLLTYDLFTDGTGTNSSSQVAITDSSNNIVAGSERARGGGVTTAQVLTASVIVTTTGAATYKLRGKNGAGTTFTLINTAGTGAGNITWQKISGYLPVSGQTVDFVSVSRSADVSVTANTAAPFNVIDAGNIPMTNGVFTLTAGKTYKLEGSVRILPSSATESFSFQWRDITNNVLIGNAGITRNGAAGAASNSEQSTAVAVIAPITNITVRLENIATTETLNSASSYAYIQQIGSTATTVPTWQSYTPTITGGTTNPTLPTSSVLNASYLVDGKTMFINFTLSYSSQTGGANGSGSYRFGLPSGYTIDTAKAIIPTSTGTAADAGYDGVSIGTFQVSNSAANYFGKVVAITSTEVGMFGTTLSGVERGLRGSTSGAILMNAAPTAYSFTAQIPIL